jgi:thymidylate kinase
MIIQFEGNELTGKTSLLRLLASKNSNYLIEELPRSTSKWGSEARTLIQSPNLDEASITLLAILDQIDLNRTLQPDQIHLQGRGILSTAVYGSLNEGVGKAISILKFLKEYLPAPDLIVFLQAPLDVLLARAESRENLTVYDMRLTEIQRHYPDVLYEFKTIYPNTVFLHLKGEDSLEHNAELIISQINHLRLKQSHEISEPILLSYPCDDELNFDLQGENTYLITATANYLLNSGLDRAYRLRCYVSASEALTLGQLTQLNQLNSL